MRILLKISGDALSWEKDFWIDTSYVEQVVWLINDIKKQWVSIAIVVWGGNIYRWWDLIKSWVKPTDSHNLSMLSTIFNWVILKDFLLKKWLETTVMNPLGINFLDTYNKYSAIRKLNDWEIIICVWWTGSPYFTTDTWWVLRALELECDMMIKATKVDGVYDKDPAYHNDAKIYKTISYDEAIIKNLKIMDITALVMARDNSLPISVVNLANPSDIKDVLNWKNSWTLIS